MKSMYVIDRLTRQMRDVLIAHIDCRVPVNTHDPKHRVIAALLTRGLIRFDPPQLARAKWTALTELGRVAVAAVLADHAEFLIRVLGFPDEAAEASSTFEQLLSHRSLDANERQLLRNDLLRRLSAKGTAPIDSGVESESGHTSEMQVMPENVEV